MSKLLLLLSSIILNYFPNPIIPLAPLEANFVLSLSIRSSGLPLPPPPPLFYGEPPDEDYPKIPDANSL